MSETVDETDELDAEIAEAETALDIGSIADRDEVEVEEDAENGKIVSPWDPNKIRVDQRPYSVQQVLDLIDSEDLVLQPEFQRRRVWTRKQQCLLIESLLLRIPLPAFYFAMDDEEKLQVVDGLQRLSTIHDFVRGPNRFRLSGLEYLQSHVGKKNFEDLKGQVWGRRIMQATLTAFVVDPQTPTEVKLNLFARLNKQGTPLSQQELRHAMSGPRSRKFLLELSKCEEFHSATGNALRDSKRMHDVEMVLRFCAFQLRSFSTYGANDSLTEFLTSATKSIDDPAQTSDDRLAELRSAFRRAMTNAQEVFGIDAFRKRENTPINRPLFEVWSYVLAQLTAGESAARAGELRDVHSQGRLGDQSFIDAISLNTGDAARVHYRFGRVIEDVRARGIGVE